MRRSVFLIIIIIVFGIFLLSVNMLSKGNLFGIIPIILMPVAFRIYTNPRFSKYHTFVKRGK